MKISEILGKKKTFSFEFFPPKTDEQLDSLIKTVKELSVFKPDFVSVTDSNFSNNKYKNFALSLLLKEHTGFNPIIHLTCINNTKKEIDTLLEKAKQYNLNNILALRGDKNPDAIKTPNDFCYSSDLLKQIDMSFFCVGAAGHPEKHPESPSIEDDIRIMKIKQDMGVSFIITQLFFENETFFRYSDLLRKNGVNIPLVAGIMPLSSKESLEKIEAKAGPIKKPKELELILEKYKDKKEDFFKYSMDFCQKQCEQILANQTGAIHFFTFNKAKAIKEIIKRLQ